MKATDFQKPGKAFLKRLSILLMLLNTVSAFSQATEIKFRVLDEKTREPIRFCYVMIQGKNVSAQSDEDGFAKIKTKPTDTLVIYQLGYFTKKTGVAEINRGNNVVLLLAQNINLEEVVVTAAEVDTFQKQNTIFFLDFEFYDNFILALVNKGRKFNSLMLMDLNGNKISERYLSVKTEDLFKDCFENLHLITSDSIYQVYYNYKNLVLLKPYPIASYHGLLKSCSCMDGSRYVFKARQYRSLKNSYYLYEEGKPNSKKTLAIVADSSAIRGFNMDYDIRYFLAQRRGGNSQYATSVTEIAKNLDKYREELELSAEYANLLRPVASEMKKADTNFLLVDFTNKSAYTFSLKGMLRRKEPLTGFEGMLPAIYIDHDARTIVFSRTDALGALTLFRYDATRNLLTHSFELKDFYYLKNFRVKGNAIYFINKDRSETMSRIKIVKAYIRWQPIHIMDTAGK